MTQRGEWQFLRESAPSPSSGEHFPDAGINTEGDEGCPEHWKETVQMSLGNQTSSVPEQMKARETEFRRLCPPPAETRARDQYLIRQLIQLIQLYEKREEVLRDEHMQSELKERRQREKRKYYKQKLKEHCLRRTNQENQLKYQIEQAVQRESMMRKDVLYMLELSLTAAQNNAKYSKRLQQHLIKVSHYQSRI